MKLALLGVDDDALALARWAVEQGRHELALAYDVANRAVDVLRIAPRVVIGETWESLLAGSQIDAVIVGRGLAGLERQTGIADAERRADQLRKLVQAGVPMVVVCPASESIVGFELEMIRRDTKCVILPYIPDAQHPAVARLAEIRWSEEDDRLGFMEQYVFERELNDRSRERVLVQLARDIAVLQQITTGFRGVSAAGSAATLGRDPLGPKPKTLPALANLTAHFIDLVDGIEARWSVGPARDGERGRLTIFASQANAILDMPADGKWTLTVSGDPPQTETFDFPGNFERIFWQLGHAQSADEFFDESAWIRACRDQEAAEAADRSLQRGKYIELFKLEHTEAASFKSVMASGGCLVLAIALVALLFVALLDGLQVPIRELRAWRLWPIYLLVPIAVFLVLQLLQLALKRDAKPLAEPSAARTR